MTFSILARDPETGALGGAAATGSLCVGGWVLRGDVRAGVSASQGASPSTLWGEDVLTAMRSGVSAQRAVEDITGQDMNRDDRQLAALSHAGDTAAFTGARNTPEMGSLPFDGGIAAGNMLTGTVVLDAMTRSYQSAAGGLAQRLMAALQGGSRAGGDYRGLLSAALLVVSRDHAPFTLRIDYSETPLADLEALLARATSGDYHHWFHMVPTLNDPMRGYG